MISTSPRVERRRLAPSGALMHFGFVLAGLGTLLLGPILPILARRWHMQDSDSGLLFVAKFVGSFLGGITVSVPLRRTLLVGFAAAAIGFGGFAFAPGMMAASAGLFIGGYGLGQIITSINILAGRRYTSHRGSSLALLNFSWSFGALLSPLLAAWLTPLYPLRVLLAIFASAFVGGGAILLVQMRGAREELSPNDLPDASHSGLTQRVFLYFAGLMLLYGGLETCVSGWLTTYALRYGSGSLQGGEYTLVLLLIGLTTGRALASLVLVRVSERLLQRVSLALCALFTAALALAHTATGIGVFAVLLGLSLAPFFPITFSLLIAERPTARQAGVVMAVSGLGAAALPWLMGVLSTRSGSLQLALVLPFIAAVLLLGMSLFRSRNPAGNPS